MLKRKRDKERVKDEKKDKRKSGEALSDGSNHEDDDDDEDDEEDSSSSGDLSAAVGLVDVAVDESISSHNVVFKKQEYNQHAAKNC